ncbi:DUF3624 domain-containing protein [Vibrio caribbeanicus]|uniref:DUF3624 domain-containing protein n=1 Tax=Vibrio caribbeanicus TaxID=701175 RepID=UPI002284009B|nr:DUF3624 domain-containing protein [Vibrio caribbeanicus]MCY9845835.1 DUF3624 domain-containing protein [Vibrio caribbeanicus]
MTCSYCKNNPWFWKKIGRCTRCIKQLSVLCCLCVPSWWLIFRDTPTSIGSITLLMACFCFLGLLFLHLWSWVWRSKRLFK